MKVSIIVPVYNVEDYVLECLNSIKNLSIDYEIIVVNDGSKDNSLANVNEFASSYKGELKIINKENGGLSSARNAGIEHAKGDYLFFLDSDDYVNKQLFEKFVNDAVSDNVDIGFADYAYLRKGKIAPNTEAAYRKKIATINNNVISGLTYGDRFFDAVHNFFNVEACFLLVKKSLLFDNSIEFKRGIYHEDTLFTITCLVCAKSARYYDYPFYIYRMREDSIMHTPNPKVVEKKYQDKCTIALELFTLCRRKNISARFIDTLIVDLLLVSVMHFKKIIPEVPQVLSFCRRITLKTRIRIVLYKILSLGYAKS